MAVPGLCCCVGCCPAALSGGCLPVAVRGLPLVAVSRGSSSVVLPVLLISVASPVAECRLYTLGLQYFQHVGSAAPSVAAAPGL